MNCYAAKKNRLRDNDVFFNNPNYKAGPGKPLINGVIYQHLPRGSVWIQGMVYGHPLSSIQHPLEDPGIITSISRGDFTPVTLG